MTFLSITFILLYYYIIINYNFYKTIVFSFVCIEGGGYKKVIYITYIHLIINNDTEESQQCTPTTPVYSCKNKCFFCLHF